MIPLTGRISGETQWLGEAENAAKVILSLPAVPPQIEVYTHMGLGLLAVQTDNKDAARKTCEVLQVAKGTIGLGSETAVDRILGVLNGFLGEANQAGIHFEDALAFCRKAGYRPELAWTCFDYADTLLQRNEHGDREKAMSLLDESLAISSELGMRPLMERVLSRREILKA